MPVLPAELPANAPAGQPRTARPRRSRQHPALSRAPGATFAALGVAAALVAVLARDGITAPRPIQAGVLPGALAGRDIRGCAQAGSGKTLGFSLPLVARLAGGTRWRAARAGWCWSPPRAGHPGRGGLAAAGGCHGADRRRHLRRYPATAAGGRAARSLISSWPARGVWPASSGKVTASSGMSRSACSVKPARWPARGSCRRSAGCSGLPRRRASGCCSRRRSGRPRAAFPGPAGAARRGCRRAARSDRPLSAYRPALGADGRGRGPGQR